MSLVETVTVRLDSEIHARVEISGVMESVSVKLQTGVCVYAGIVQLKSGSPILKVCGLGKEGAVKDVKGHPLYKVI